MNCFLELNADDLWQCTREKCGWIYKLRSDKPPKRNCPAAPGATPPPTLTERLDDRYNELEDPSFLRPREQVDALLAKCETNQCGRFDTACQLCKRIVTGCEGIGRWIRYLTDARKWCTWWSPEPKQQCRSGQCGRRM
jgi:hypothetical protein